MQRRVMIMQVRVRRTQGRDMGESSHIHMCLSHLPLRSLCVFSLFFSLSRSLSTFPLFSVLTSVTVFSFPLDGNLITELTGHTESVTSIAFSPDGKTIATSSDDSTGRLWSLGIQLHITLTVFRFLPAPPQFHCNSCWSPSSPRMATARVLTSNYGLSALSLNCGVVFVSTCFPMSYSCQFLDCDPHSQHDLPAYGHKSVSIRM
jgi:WD40 repeat protein